MTLILLILSAIAGIVGITSFIQDIKRGLSSKSWIQIEATITKSKLKKEKEKGDRPVYMPIINFSYQYHGNEFVCTEHKLSNFGTGDQEAMTKLINTYSKNKKVTAYVNPLNPEEAELTTGIQGSDFISLAYGLVFGILAICIYIKDFY